MQNGKQKKAGVAIFSLDKIDFRLKTVARGKETHYIITNILIPQEDITIINIYALQIRACKHIRKILT